MSFNPSDFGFEQVKVGNRGGDKKDYCYIRLSNREKGRRKAAVLCLDEETTDICQELFGASVGVAIDDRCRIVLYKGTMRKLSKANGKNVKKSISLETETERINGVLGDFNVYKYDSKIYAKGEAILLSPIEAVY